PPPMPPARRPGPTGPTGRSNGSRSSRPGSRTAMRDSDPAGAHRATEYPPAHPCSAVCTKEVDDEGQKLAAVVEATGRIDRRQARPTDAGHQPAAPALESPPGLI